MIVLDASVLANVVGDDGGPGARARALVADEESLAGPDLVDVETVSVLRRRWLTGTLDDRRFEQAVGDFADLPLVRVPTLALMRRAFELRANVTAYDACYVALAELLECPLVTATAASPARLGCAAPCASSAIRRRSRPPRSFSHTSETKPVRPPHGEDDPPGHSRAAVQAVILARRRRAGLLAGSPARLTRASTRVVDPALRASAR